MKKNGVIYVLCPANQVTGGPDALHQMVYYLNHVLCFNAYIVYFDTSYSNSLKNISIPAPYKIYIDEFKKEIDVIDDEENIVVIPEYYSKKRKLYKKCKIYIWWLGINSSLSWNCLKKISFFATLPLRILKNLFYKNNNVMSMVRYVLNTESYPFNKESLTIAHLCASYHAFEYVSQRSHNKVFLCIEPISKLFLEKYLKEKNSSWTSRNNVILYNPKRNYTNLVKKISQFDPELKFEPLQGLTQQQLIDKYKSSKLYVDFGGFPGAERIPKESVLYGCAIITGKRGASGFHGDVPIPEEYKFENPENQIEEIVEKIRFVLKNYESVYSDFDEYRKTVLSLEENFVKSLKEIFLQQN